LEITYIKAKKLQTLICCSFVALKTHLKSKRTKQGKAQELQVPSNPSCNYSLIVDAT
jgi:hypothetical protein